MEVLYSSEYVVEFNGQLMRLPNPFFGPGMNCRGKVSAAFPVEPSLGAPNENKSYGECFRGS